MVKPSEMKECHIFCDKTLQGTNHLHRVITGAGHGRGSDRITSAKDPQLGSVYRRERGQTQLRVFGCRRYHSFRNRFDFNVQIKYTCSKSL